MIQRHPVLSFDRKLNFWEEFPDYKVHPKFGDFWQVNKDVDRLKESSLFMWALALCYDRSSSFFAQPEQDKWEVVSEDLFDDINFLTNIALGNDQDKVVFKLGITFRDLISSFQESIDTPLGISLRLLETKLLERTTFIVSTSYTLDSYVTSKAGKTTLQKGTADQLDRMFANTEKINTLIQKAMDALKASEGSGNMKGGQKESLSDGSTKF